MWYGRVLYSRRAEFSVGRYKIRGFNMDTQKFFSTAILTPGGRSKTWKES